MYNATSNTACNSIGSDRTTAAQANPCVADSLERANKALSELNSRLVILGERIHGSSPVGREPNAQTGAPSLRESAANVASLAEAAIAHLERISGGITGQ